MFMVRMLSIVSGPMTRLLLLDKATIEWQAGLLPGCTAATRHLDSLTLSVHKAECVVIRHADAAGARVLSAAIAGSPLLRHASVSHGRRFAVSGLRVRRSSIREGVLSPLLAGWLANAGTPTQFAEPGKNTPDHQLQLAPGRTVAVSEPQPWRRRPENTRPPVSRYSPGSHLLHVLRVSRSGSPSGQEAMEWRRWATQHARLGHSLILLVPAALSLPELPELSLPAQRLSGMPWPGLSPHELAPTTMRLSQPGLRILQLRYGRCGPVR